MNKTLKETFEEKELNEAMDKIKYKIMIMSNKGGVGKSTVAANLAVSLAKKGYKTGLLDIDIHGPSQAQLFAIKNKRHQIINDKIEPFLIDKIKLVTTAGLFEDDTQPVIWRGPLKITLIKQFLKDVNWGELDYLLIDSPPGTGDEPLTIAQLLPDISGIIIVTTPQELAVLDSKKAINFARKLNVPILGWIENMAVMTCPHCGKNINLFAGDNSIFEKESVRLLAKLPFEPTMLLNMFKKSMGSNCTDKLFEDICDIIINKKEDYNGKQPRNNSNA